ncbi:hypothetical protein GRX03_01810 [Halovenus sp. WSH3]|uniref:Uncharacterized protein n=1 Tax=Halovenus carboxidivorans TaxID=2692199 RepID=A0A6B0T283_9EURY|nr:hypothetical protein [Halovenus carboxidivorans]MXR50346.1 hypothetical protein [Halovenus carboxidivorans]
MNRRLLVVGVVAVLALAGCAGLGGESEPANEQPSEDAGSSVVETGVRAANATAGATNVTYAVGIEVTEAAAGEDLSNVGATLPQGAFTVDPIRNDEILIGIDTDGDGTIDRGFQESAVDSVDNTDNSFDVRMSSEYTLQAGDVVLVQHPDIDNPGQPGEYTVETRLNGQQTDEDTVLIE